MILNFDQFLTSLTYMAYGMGGIFLVVLVIYLVIVLLGKLPAGHSDKKD